MVSNVTVNGKQLGKCLKDSGCFIATFLKSIPCFLFTTCKAMNQPRLHLWRSARGTHSLFSKMFCFLSEGSFGPKRRLWNQKSLLFRGRRQSHSAEPTLGSAKPRSSSSRLSSRVCKCEREAQRCIRPVKNAQLKSPSLF